MSIEQAINNACACVEMEGYSINDDCKKKCRQLLEGEIDLQQYIDFVKEKAGVSA